MSTILYVLLALLLLGIMIMVHELGHFLMARACGISVRAFAVGFGPKIWSRVSKKSGIEYSVRPFLCGGFCAFYGEDDPDAKETDPRAFNSQPAWRRLLTVAAGPFMNFVLAFVVALAFFMGYGVPVAGDEIQTRIEAVSVASAAEEAGLLPEDYILTVNGETINGNFGDYVTAWKTGDAPLVLTVKRGEEIKELSVTPRYSESDGRNMVGVTMVLLQETKWEKLSFFKTLSHTGAVCLSAATSVVDGLKSLVTTKDGLNNMSGLVGTVSVIADQTREYHLMGYLNMLIVISINLGLVNLFPFPGLDGCRILFTLFEIIFRRPVNRKVEAYIHLFGYLILFLLMIYFVFHDVMNLLG